MQIRFATNDDLEILAQMGKELFFESRFRNLTLNEEKGKKGIKTMIEDQASCCVLLAETSEKKIVGMLLGYANEYFFCDSIMAQDRYFYVQPKSRGTSAAVKLLLAFRKWAELRKVNELCINMSVAIEPERFDKLMKHLGFQYCGSNFSLQIRQY